MKKALLFLLIFIINNNIYLFAQQVPVGTAGWQISPNGSQGFVMNSKNLRISQLTSKVFNSNTYLQDVRTKQNQILYRFTKPFLTEKNTAFSVNKRKLGMMGYSIYPSLAVGIAWAKEQSANSDLERDDAGFALVPALNLALPFSEIEINFNTTYYFNGNTSLGKFKFQPTIGFKADGLFEMLGHDVELKSQTDMVTMKTVVDKVDYTTEKTTISYHYQVDAKSNQYYSWTVLGFGGITPRYTFTRPMPYVGKTEMLGIGYNLRGMNSGLDFIAETGKQGYASMLNSPAYTYDPEPEGAKIAEDSGRFSSVGTQTRLFARYSIDLKELLFNFLSSTPDPGETVLSKNTTKFGASKKSNAFRVMGGIGFGYAWVKKPEFVYEGARAALDKRFEENPDMLHNGWNDPQKIKSGVLVHYFVAIEFGVMGIEWGTTQLRSSPLSNSGAYKNIALYYTFPLGKIASNLKGIREAKRKLIERANSEK